MPIGVDDVVSATHMPAPFGCVARPKNQTLVWFARTLSLDLQAVKPDRYQPRERAADIL
jgi:hypothetical protein